MLATRISLISTASCSSPTAPAWYNHRGRPTMRQRWLTLSETDRILVQIAVLAALGFLYAVWPTPYAWGYRTLPQAVSEFDVASEARYRVQVNRFTGTVWAETVEGWRRYRSRPLPQSQLSFDEQDNAWFVPG